MRHDGTGDEEHAGHFGVEHVLERLRVDLPERLCVGREPSVHGAHADAGVVDEQIDAAESIDDGVDRFGDRFLVAYVRRQADRTATQLARRGLGPFSAAARQCHGGPGVDERLGHGPPQTTRATRHDDAAAMQRLHVRRSIENSMIESMSWSFHAEDEVEFVTISYWEDVAAVSRFAGDDPKQIHLHGPR